MVIALWLLAMTSLQASEQPVAERRPLRPALHDYATVTASSSRSSSSSVRTSGSSTVPLRRKRS